MIYDVNYFISKFEAIPEKQWCTNDFVRGNSKCANGHCGIDKSWQGPYDENKEAFALATLFEVLGDGSNIYHNKVFNYTAHINDGGNNKYQQPTPKQRILAALYDVKKMQEPLYKDITTSLAAVAQVEERADQPVRVLKSN